MVEHLNIPVAYMPKPDADFVFMMQLKYLADSELDYGCFIGEDINGDVSDDWLIDDFEKECD